MTFKAIPKTNTNRDFKDGEYRCEFFGVRMVAGRLTDNDRCLNCEGKYGTTYNGYCFAGDVREVRDGIFMTQCQHEAESLSKLEFLIGAGKEKALREFNGLKKYSRDTSYSNFIKTIDRLIEKGKMSPQPFLVSELNKCRTYIDAENRAHEIGMKREYNQLIKDFRSNRMTCKYIAKERLFDFTCDLSFAISECSLFRMKPICEYWIKQQYANVDNLFDKCK